LKTQKTLKPGQRGTKQWMKQYGNSLLFVRYRYDDKKRFTTVELIVDESYINKNNTKIPQNKILPVKVLRKERHIQKMVKSVGGEWDSQHNVWKMPYKEIVALGLDKRIVKIE